MFRQRYYVVFRGHQPGIYTLWPECQMQVLGYSGSSYKMYHSLHEAEEAFARFNEASRYLQINGTGDRENVYPPLNALPQPPPLGTAPAAAQLPPPDASSARALSHNAAVEPEHRHDRQPLHRFSRDGVSSSSSQGQIPSQLCPFCSAFLTGFVVAAYICNLNKDDN